MAGSPHLPIPRPWSAPVGPGRVPTLLGDASNPPALCQAPWTGTAGSVRALSVRAKTTAR